MVGADPYSPTRMAGSGLLRTWDYFYNSGGWDDYPPQHALRGNKSHQSVTPVGNLCLLSAGGEDSAPGSEGTGAEKGCEGV